MIADRFDTLTRRIGARTSRRVALGLAATGLLSSERDASALACQHNSDCPGNQTCKNDTCVEKCGDPGSCNSDFVTCQDNPACFCAKKPGGGKGLCVQSVSCAAAPGCHSQSDCPEGLVCGTGCCAPNPKFVCQPPCGTVAVRRSSEATTMSGQVGR